MCTLVGVGYGSPNAARSTVTSFPRSLMDTRIGGLAHGYLTPSQFRTNAVRRGVASPSQAALAGLAAHALGVTFKTAALAPC
jgi:hypothetical protein